MQTDIERIQAFWTRIKPEYDRVHKARQENYGRSFLGFGICDDDEYRRAEQKHAEDSARLLAEEASLEWTWNLVKEIYGERLVSLALDDLNKVVGTLPYIDQ